MSNGFKIIMNPLAAGSGVGIATLVNITGNTWCMSGVMGVPAGGTFIAGGSKALASALQSLRLYIDGTQLFDGGSVNVLYE